MKSSAPTLLVLSILMSLAGAVPGYADLTVENLTCAQAAPSLERLNAPRGAFKLNPVQLTRWIRSRDGAPRGVVLVIHGLDIRPSRMGDISNALADSGFDVLRVALTGHRGSLAEMRTVSHEGWLEETFLSYCVARERASALGVPLHAVGFSLGGALIEDLLNQARAEKPVIESAVLFAPAVALTGLTKMGWLLNAFGQGFALPTRFIGGYRATNWLPMPAYNSTVATTHAVRGSDMARSNIPTLVFGDRNDELVSTRGVARLARAKHLDAWTFERVKISAGPPFPFKLRHIIIDEQAMGRAQWQLMTAAMLNHFRGQAHL